MKDYPLIKYVILFISGIILERIFQLDSFLLIIFTAALFFIAAIIFFLKLRMSLLNFILFVLIISTGAAYYSVSQLKTAEYPFEKYKYTKTVLCGKITNIDLIKDERIGFEVETDSLYLKNELIIIKINMLCRIFDEPDRLKKIYSELEVGNYVEMSGTLQHARGKRNPGEFDYYAYLITQNISALMNVYKASDFQIKSKSIDIFGNFVHTLRKNMDEAFGQFNSHRAAALLRGLLLADRSKIDYSLKENFVNAGVVHVLAVSGLHVGYIVLIFYFIFGRFNIYLRYILTVAGLIIFVIITGSPPSVFRASLMAIIMIISFVYNRSYNSVNSLALAAFILLILNPAELFNPGFQLSFSAVLSIIILYPRIREKINSLNISSASLKWILLFLGVSISAQIGTLPFTLVYFHKLSVVAIFANLIVIPLIGCLVALGLFTLLLSFVWGWLAMVYGAANSLLTDILFWFVTLTGDLKFSHLYIRSFSLYDTTLFYVMMIFAIKYWKHITSMSAKIIFMVLITANSFLFFSLDDFELLPENKLSVLAMDVGQGDGLLLKMPQGEIVLIDAGNATEYFDNGERVILPLLKYLGIDKIDYCLISHLDADHYMGIYSVIPKVEIKKLMMPYPTEANPRNVDFENFLSANEIDFEYYQKSILKIGDCRIYILNDTTDTLPRSFDTNNSSGMLKIVFGETEILFTGDAEHIAENYFINNYYSFLESDVLKVGHHGSKSSTSRRFLDLVDPEYGIISAGIQNKFKHPAPEVIEQLFENGVKTKRTDKEGAILFQSNGKTLEFVQWKKLDSNSISNY